MTEVAALSIAETSTLEAPEPEQYLTWHAFDLKSGRRGQEITVRSTPPVGRLIGEPTDAQVEILCWDVEQQAAVPGWEAASDPGRAMIVALDENEQPVWAGMVLTRVSNADEWVELSLTTCEAYFDRRYVSNRHYVQTDQAVIVTGVLADGTETGIELVIDAPASGRPRDRTYIGDEDKTVLSVLQDLMGVEGGPEFTIDLEWADASRTVLKRVLRVRNRLGRASARPTAVFEMPGCVTDFTYTEDYTSENGANDVMAVSSGQGAARPQSPHMIATELLEAGWVRYEHRYTPETSITSQQVLDSHARQELTSMKHGLRELVLEASLADAPRVGSDFNLGDDVAAVLTCPRFPAQADVDGAVSAGYEHVLRCIGWELDIEGLRLRPRLVEVD